MLKQTLDISRDTKIQKPDFSPSCSFYRNSHRLGAWSSSTEGQLCAGEVAFTWHRVQRRRTWRVGFLQIDLLVDCPHHICIGTCPEFLAMSRSNIDRTGGPRLIFMPDNST